MDIARFREDGYVVLRSAVTQQMLDAAAAEVDGVIATDPAIADAGVHSRNVTVDCAPACFAALAHVGLWSQLTSLVAPGELEIVQDIGQLVVNNPPSVADVAFPHIDLHVPSADRPTSFTLLVALLMTDQVSSEAGNVWVWPGTHSLYGEYLAAYGPCSLLEHGGSLRRAAPNVRLPRPVPVCGARGDVLVAHPLLGHATGPNTSGVSRRAIYFRLRRTDHDVRWQQCLRDPLIEYAAPGP
jgi:hypothetical protein